MLCKHAEIFILGYVFADIAYEHIWKRQLRVPKTCYTMESSLWT